jgi:HK97 gp10 family phage protein
MSFVWHGDRIQAIVDREINARMTAQGEQFVERARSLAPTRTGVLRAEIGFTYSASTKTLRLYANAPYSLLIETGTRFTRAQPFFRPAVNQSAHVWGNVAEIAFPAIRSSAGGGPKLRRSSVSPRRRRGR